jgi:hypothetical protein
VVFVVHRSDLCDVLLLLQASAVEAMAVVAAVVEAVVAVSGDRA